MISNYRIAQTEDFAKPIFRKEVKGNSIEVADLPLKGRYFWRVIADHKYESSAQQVIFKASEAV